MEPYDAELRFVGLPWTFCVVQSVFSASGTSCGLEALCGAKVSHKHSRFAVRASWRPFPAMDNNQNLRCRKQLVQKSLSQRALRCAILEFEAPVESV
eukprot:6486250-Amphidinium_carterae.2